MPSTPSPIASRDQGKTRAENASGSENITERRGTLGAVLRRPYEIYVRRVYAEIAQMGFADVRPAHSAVFRFILPDGSRVTDLAERAQITKQSMAYLVDYLHEQGYATFVPDPTDGRAKLVRLTERGVAVQEALITVGVRFEAAMAEQIGSDKMQQLRTLLEQVRAFLEQDTHVP